MSKKSVFFFVMANKRSNSKEEGKVTDEDAVLESVGGADDAGSELRHGCVGKEGCEGEE
jgi:hypothetical protein